VVFAIAATVMLSGRQGTLVWALGLPLVGASRLFLGAHDITDVAASVVFAGGSVHMAGVLSARSLVGLDNTEKAAMSRRSTSDDDLDSGTAAVRDRTLTAIHGRSIVRLHLGHVGTVAALPGILDALHQRSLTAVTVLLDGVT
jgi:hypothetical protein